MFFSFTGSSIHFHICSHTGKIYSDIHLADIQKHQDANSCCEEDTPNNKHTCDTCQMPEGSDQHADCCVDIEKEFETDNNYKFTQHNFNSDPAELNILHNNAEPEIDLFSDNTYRKNRDILPPSGIPSTVVLLL
jgi:hypothetical protein